MTALQYQGSLLRHWGVNAVVSRLRDDLERERLMNKALLWLNRGALNALLTEQLRQVAGCQGATLQVGASRDVGAAESNWNEFICTPRDRADPYFVRAVAGGVVSEARERYNVLDS
jgi:hypothetical protein